jgi:hypothetical protein
MITFEQILDIPEEDWQPDARFRVSYEALEKTSLSTLEKKIKKGKFPIKFLNQTITIGISNNIDEFSLKKGTEDGILFSMKLKGDVSVKHPLLSFSTPYSGRLEGNLVIDVHEKMLRIRTNKINDIKVSTKILPQISLTEPIKDWINDSLKEVPPQDILELDFTAFAARDLRFVGSTHSLDIELLSHFPKTQSLPMNRRRPRGDWEMEISNDTLSKIVRQKTFELKATGNGVNIDAQNLFIEKRNLNVSLRLWKLEGWGQWWRDYTIQCPILIENEELKLGEASADLIEKSKGAGLADPLALLAEGYILETIKQQIQYSMPNTQQAKLSGQTLQIKINGVLGNQKAFIMYGDLEDSNKEPKKKRKRRRRSKEK